MSKDKRAEIVEAMAREMCRTLAPCASMVSEIMDDATYLRGHEGDAAALTLAGQLRIQAEAALGALGAEKKRAELTALRARVAVMQEALEIIAGKRQCLDNLMGNKDVALAALGLEVEG